MKRNFAQSMISEVKSPIQFIHESIPECHNVISEVFNRADKKNLIGNINEDNKPPKTINCDTLRQQNISFDHPGKRDFHFNFFGSK